MTVAELFRMTGPMVLAKHGLQNGKISLQPMSNGNTRVSATFSVTVDVPAAEFEAARTQADAASFVAQTLDKLVAHTKADLLR